MANVTDPGGIAFCNGNIRPAADAYAQAYNQFKKLELLWGAKGMAALFPNDPTAIVMDAANASVAGGPDGRTVITAADVNGLMALASAFCAACEANNGATLALVGKIAVNP